MKTFTQEEPEVIKTEELFRVNYGFEIGDEDCLRFMKQTYSIGKPFYYRTKGMNFTNVETSSENISEIIKYLERCLRIDKEPLKKTKNKAVLDICKGCIKTEEEFLNKIKEYNLFEQNITKSDGVDNG